MYLIFGYILLNRDTLDSKIFNLTPTLQPKKKIKLKKENYKIQWKFILANQLLWQSNAMDAHIV